MLHMIKLAAGCSCPNALRQWVKEERINGQAFVRTRTMPKRTNEILAGGSLYRVINGLILCRQPITGFTSYTRPDGHTGTLVLISDDVIPVQMRPVRAFQGWRYLKDEDTPPDLQDITHQDGVAELPPKLRKRLTELALL